MNLRKIAVQLLIMLNFVTAVHAADFQQVQLKGPKNSSNQFSGTIYGPIESSDTLWQISQKYRQNNGLSVYQVMQAIYELNPDAFEQQNINLLKNGSILKLPSERYIARVSSQQAKEKSERDSQNLQTSTSSSSTGANLQNGSDKQVAATLDQTNELIEQKLGAIDEAQNRQFMAIRKQFAESIGSVQSILDENKKLFERLDKVNTDIDEMRSEEQQKSLQMNQMGGSIDELLKKSRQDDAEKAAQLAEKGTSVLDNPVVLILLFTLPVLILLTAFAYWMIKRKQPVAFKPEEDDEVNLSLDPIAAEMDDLSDALSAELSGEVGDELHDDNLFGDDDLVDDVLTQELEESLDDVPENISEPPLSNDSEIFDELGDDALDDLLEDEFEAGASVVEQDDLDSLFDEDDDLLADIDQEIAADEDLADDLLAEVQDSVDNSDYANISTEEDDPQANTEAQDVGSGEDESLLAPSVSDDDTTIELVTDDDEQPEISIDELLDISIDEVIENPIIDSSEDINEEVLQNLDKEIVSQNEELDIVTGSLIDELEQVEQMRSMMPEYDEKSSEVEEPQLDIQKLDDLAEEINDDLLTDNFDKQDSDDPNEIDISEVLKGTVQLDKNEEVFEQDQTDDVDGLVESEPQPLENTDSLVEPESLDDIEALIESEPLEGIEALVESEPLDDIEDLVESEPEPIDDIEALIESEPEPIEDIEALVESEPLDDIEALVESEPEPLDDIEALVESEPEPEPLDDIEDLVESEPEPLDDIKALVESKPEFLDDIEALVESEPEPLDDIEALVESKPEPIEDIKALVESKPEPIEDIEDLVESEPEPLDDIEDLVESEPEPIDDIEALVEPEPLDDTEALIEPELQVDDSLDEEDEFDRELSTEPESEVHTSSDSTLDEDQLEKALEDFGKEELDEVLGDLASNETASTSSLDDLEFSADDFVTKDQSSKAFSTPTPTPMSALDDIGSVDDFDDSELDLAFDENIDELSNDPSQNNNDELDDLPGLGDWLDEDEVTPVAQQTSASIDKDIIEELEESNFDEMLESMDLDDDISATEEDNTGFDIAALLDETPQTQDSEFNEQDTEDFLDVEALLNESVGAESDDDIDRALDLDIPLEPFVNEQDNLEMIDVDADDGLGAKLDLAHAYIEIGEEESAKELLDEVLQKGSEEQIAQANVILNQMD